MKNDPINVRDPTGMIGHVAGGALIGAAAGLALEGASQLLRNKFELRRLLAATAGGAVTGALTAATFGAAGIGAITASDLVAGGLIGGVGGSVQTVAAGDTYTTQKAVVDFSLGAIAVGFTEGLRRALTPYASGINTAADDFVRNGEDAIADPSSTITKLTEGPGTATVMQHPGDPLHVSVKVNGGEHTHQVITSSDLSSTRIVTTSKVDAGQVSRSVVVELNDAAAASARQRELLKIRNLGEYDKITNSCVSHVCDILGAGGKTVPPATSSAQIKYLLKLLKRGD